MVDLYINTENDLDELLEKTSCGLQAGSEQKSH
jgi:hypothetical protein